MLITALDHLVLTIRDIALTCRFYTSVLGMRKVNFGDGRTALAFGEQKINLHEADREFEPKAALPTPGSADLYFRTDTPMDDSIAHLQSHSVAIEEGPVKRTGATGPILSIFVRDPDGNLIEIARPAPPVRA